MMQQYYRVSYEYENPVSKGWLGSIHALNFKIKDFAIWKLKKVLLTKTVN